MVEEEKDFIARVVWKDITFLRTKEANPKENWDEILIRWETIGRIKEKDNVLRVCMEQPISHSDLFETMNVPLVQLIPLANVESVEMLSSTKKK